MNRLLVIIPIVLLLAMSPRLVVTPASAARPPLVLAFYYDWFDENIWKPNQVADFPAVRYTSRDPQAMARQIQQARGAGIDAFVVSWWGAGNPTDENLKLLLNQAQAAHFSIAVDFELTSPFYRTRDDTINSLRNLLGTHARQPAYLKVNGKPVIFFWRQQKYPVAVWQAIRNTVDPNRQSLWIAEGTDTSYLSVFDGHHLYSIGWARDVAGVLQKYAGQVRAYGADKIWAATVMPGNDDTRTRRAGAYYRDRRGGDFYRETWSGALSTFPDWVVITSWNEWVEGTMIEPSVTYGDLYLNLTRELAGRFKGGLPAPTARPTATRTPGPTPTPTVTPTLIPGGVRANVTDLVRVRAEASTEAAILGRLREGAAVTLLAASEDGKWWQIAYPNVVQRGWIAAEFTKPSGDTRALPVAASIIAPTVAQPPTEMPATAEPEETPEIQEAVSEPTPTPEEGPRERDASLSTPPPPTPQFWLPWLGDLLPFLH